jgi:four helix bundle protein
MTYQRFEELPVWSDSIRLAERVFALNDAVRFRNSYSLRNQIERASLSVSCNIAEGFERGTTKELLNFIYIARGSAAEVRSILLLMDRMACFKSLKLEIADLKSLAESCSRQLRAWADSLQNSTIKGVKFLNRETLSEDVILTGPPNQRRQPNQDE